MSSPNHAATDHLGRSMAAGGEEFSGMSSPTKMLLIGATTTVKDTLQSGCMQPKWQKTQSGSSASGLSFWSAETDEVSPLAAFTRCWWLW